MAVIEVIEEISEALDKKKFEIGIFVDIKPLLSMQKTRELKYPRSCSKLDQNLFG